MHISPFIVTLTALIFIATGSASADQFYVSTYAVDGKEAPFLYPPGTCPGQDLAFPLYRQDALNKPRAFKFEANDVTLTVDFVCLNGNNYWRTLMTFKSAVMHRPLEYEYPQFVESTWYKEFWDKYRLSPHADVVKEEQVRAGFWNSFLRYVPKSFPDVLKENFGLERLGSGGVEGVMVNVQAGLRLRIENGVWQDVAESDSADLAKVHRGYVGSGVNYLTVNRQRPPEGPEFLTFEPFLGHLRSQFDLPANLSGSLGSGVIDAHLQTQRYRHYRLFVPANFPRSAGEPGKAIIENYPLLLGAPGTNHLQAQTLPRKLQDINWQGGTLPDAMTYLAFRGRSMIIPEFSAEIHGRDEYVSVATTVRQLLDRYGEGNNLEDLRRHACLQRKWHGKTVPVSFSGKSESEYDLPLARGDRLPCSP